MNDKPDLICGCGEKVEIKYNDAETFDVWCENCRLSIKGFHSQSEAISAFRLATNADKILSNKQLQDIANDIESGLVAIIETKYLYSLEANQGINWISVKDRLPEKDVELLVFDGKECWICWFWEGINKFQACHEDITHYAFINLPGKEKE